MGEEGGLLEGVSGFVWTTLGHHQTRPLYNILVKTQRHLFSVAEDALS